MSEQMNAEQSVNQCLWQIQWRFNRDSMDENISDCCSSLHARSIQDMKLLNCATPSLTCQITCVSAWLEAEDSFFLFLSLQTPLLPPDQEWHQRRTVSNREAQTALILSFSSSSCSWITHNSVFAGCSVHSAQQLSWPLMLSNVSHLLWTALVPTLVLQCHPPSPPPPPRPSPGLDRTTSPKCPKCLQLNWTKDHSKLGRKKKKNSSFLNFTSHTINRSWVKIC